MSIDVEILGGNPPVQHYIEEIGQPDHLKTRFHLRLMVWHWLPLIVLAWIWGGFFAVNMTIKEARMSRYSAWAEYKKRSWWLLPTIL